MTPCLRCGWPASPSCAFVLSFDFGGASRAKNAAGTLCIGCATRVASAAFGALDAPPREPRRRPVRTRVLSDQEERRAERRQMGLVDL